MPSRGYRKGVSDGAIPSPLRVHTRLPHAIHAALRVDAVSRNVTASRIVREVVAAHYAGTPAVLPNRRGASSDLLRQLARIGNNLNQIAHEAHLMRLPLLERETRAALAELRDVLGRL